MFAVMRWLCSVLLLILSHVVAFGNETFWNLDPFCLESLCAYFSLYHDEKSREQLHMFFPSLSSEELEVLSQCVLSAKDPNAHFSAEACAVLSKLNLPGVTLLSGQQVEDPEQDLGRALILAECPGDTDKARHYACCLDVLALRVYVERQRCSSLTEHQATIEAINTVLFYEDGFRYPSKSEMFSDKFSFLSSVTDRKFGVCLGVSSLYLSLSQRLDLPLEAVTPPGHIYLRYRGGEVNIETTVGGRHLPTERYCECIDIKDIKVRRHRELVGLAFVNQGSFALQKQQYHLADSAYARAKEYVEDDDLNELIGIVKLLKGEVKKGKAILRASSKAKIQGSIAHDYLMGYVDKETLRLLFSSPGEGYEEIVRYEHALRQAEKRAPKCYEVKRRLASVVLHLGKRAEGMLLLEKCAQEFPNDIALHLQLSRMCYERLDYFKSEKYFLIADQLLQDKGIENCGEQSYTLYGEMRKKMALFSP